jgi:hypothetical protein
LLEDYDFPGALQIDDVGKVEGGITRLCEPCFTICPSRYILKSDIELALEISRLVERAIGINSQHHTHRLIDGAISYSGIDYIDLHSVAWMEPLADLPEFPDAVRRFYTQNSSRFLDGNGVFRDNANDIFEKQCVEVDLLYTN